MVESTMHGDVLKRLFKPKPIKTKYTLLDSLKERDMTLKQYVDELKIIECPKSVDRTCANFECHSNYRLLHKMVLQNEDSNKY